jgi:hypothetical protein
MSTTVGAASRLDEAFSTRMGELWKCRLGNGIVSRLDDDGFEKLSQNHRGAAIDPISHSTPNAASVVQKKAGSSQCRRGAEAQRRSPIVIPPRATPSPVSESIVKTTA